MSTPPAPHAARQLWASLRMLVVLTVLLGLAYPLLMTGFAQLVFPGRADGSLTERDGDVVGSSLIGQSFAGRQEYFQSRPSAAGARRRSYRRVPQEGVLLDGTVLANIRLGHPGVDDAEVDAAVDRLGLRDWISRLPDGVRTTVGERGEQLSVGERQLVALIRAEVADAGLLILDEATSAVDPETERALSSALVRLAEGRTLVSVAHRLSIAEAADMVVVVDHGRIVEQGHHDELVALGGVYAGLHRSWVGNTRSAA